MKANLCARDRILETAGRLFYEQGYQATGINQIIEEADVAKASLYQHFKSKEELLQTYLENMLVEWRTALDEHMGHTAPGKPSLVRLFEYRKQKMEIYGFRGCHFLRVAYELPQLDEHGQNIIRSQKAAIKAFIVQQVQQLQPAPSKARATELGELIFNLYEGAALQCKLQHSTKAIDDAKKTMLKLISPAVLETW